MKPFILCGALVCVATAIETPKFDSSSIVPGRPDSSGLSMHVQYVPQPVRLTMNNVTLKFCLQQAYSVTQHQVFGPAWIKSARYDVTASLPTGRVLKQVWPALQTLLDEHFKLSLQRETKVMPIYALTVAKSGPKLQPAREGHERSTDLVGPENSSGTVNLKNASIKQFCDLLSRRMDRQVVDATGITGSFDIALNYQQDRDRSGSPFSRRSSGSLASNWSLGTKRWRS